MSGLRQLCCDWVACVSTGSCNCGLKVQIQGNKSQPSTELKTRYRKWQYRYLSLENFLSSNLIFFLLVMVRASSHKLFGISLSLVPIQDFKLGVLFLL